MPDTVTPELTIASKMYGSGTAAAGNAEERMTLLVGALTTCVRVVVGSIADVSYAMPFKMPP